MLLNQANSLMLEAWLLRLSGRLLRLPARAVSTASTYLQHTLLQQKSMGLGAAHTSPEMLVAACLLLASKVEEAAVSNNHLLNLVTLLHQLITEHRIPPSCIPTAAAQEQQGQQQQSQQQDQNQQGDRGQLSPSPLQPSTAEAAPQPTPLIPPSTRTIQSTPSAPMIASTPVVAGAPPLPTHTPAALNTTAAAHTAVPATNTPPHVATSLSQCRLLVGDAYYVAKEQLLLAEQVVLRLLRFRLPTPHPTSTLLHMAAVLRVPSAVAARSLCVLHDCASFSTVLLPLPPAPSVRGEREGRQGVDMSGREGSKECAGGWGVQAETDEAVGHALMRGQCLPAADGSGNSAQGANTAAAGSLGSSAQEENRAAAAAGVATAVDQRAANDQQQTHTQEESLLRTGGLLPELSQAQQQVGLGSHLHEILVAAACLHLASQPHLLPSETEKQQQADNPPLLHSTPSVPQVLYPPTHAHLQPATQQAPSLPHHHQTQHSQQSQISQDQKNLPYQPQTQKQHSYHQRDNQQEQGQGDAWSGEVHHANKRQRHSDGEDHRASFSPVLHKPAWSTTFGVSPEAVETVAAVILGAITRARAGLAELEKG